MTTKPPRDPIKKSEKMLEKNVLARRTFNLPDSEHVIQDYHASMWRTAIYAEGHLWVTENYVCFACSVPSVCEKIPFSRVKEFKKYSPGLVLSTGIKIEMEDGTSYSLASFVHRDEAFEIMSYVWKHPISYVALKKEPTGGPRAAAAASSGTGLFGDIEGDAGSGGSGGGGGGLFGGGGAGGGAGSSRAFGTAQRREVDAGDSWVGGQEQVKVDVKSSTNALRLVHEIRQIGVDTLDELALQAEQIDRIENEVEHIHSNLDKADRHLRGIESLGGAFANAVTDAKKVGQPVDFTYKDRTIGFDRKKMEDIDVEMLYKHDSDKLTKASIRFGHDSWSIFDASPKAKPNTLVHKNATGGYDESLSELVLRARPYHLDIRFKDPKRPRLRLMSSNCQIIVNEFVLRAQPPVEVTFEKGIDKFDYGSVALSTANWRLADRGTGASQAKTGGFRRAAAGDSTQTSSLISDPKLRAQMEQTEADLDEISDVLGDLHGMAVAIGDEADRSGEQLRNVNDRVGEANDRLAYQNHRINRMI